MKNELAHAGIPSTWKAEAEGCEFKDSLGLKINK